MYKLITINRELTNEDLEQKQPILVPDYYKNALVVLPISFLENIDEDFVLDGMTLDKTWSWSLKDGDNKLGKLKRANEYRARWVHLTRELSTKIEKAIEIANKKSIKIIDKNGRMYCKRCDINWDWNENAPNAAYKDLTCPVCNTISKEV